MPKAYNGGSSNGLEEKSSAGTSFSISESSPDTSGETSTAGHQPPARSAASHSEVAPEEAQTNSDASLTDGSTQGTSRSRQSLPDSLEEKTAPGKGSGTGPKRK